MKRGARPNGSWSGWALMLVLLALLARAAVPAGFMIAADARGRPAIVVCPGTAEVPAGHHHHRKGTPQGMPCPFAVAAAPLVPPTPPAVTGERAAPPPAPFTAALPSLLRAKPAAAPPPATGPPSTT